VQTAGRGGERAGPTGASRRDLDQAEANNRFAQQQKERAGQLLASIRAAAGARPEDSFGRMEQAVVSARVQAVRAGRAVPQDQARLVEAGPMLHSSS